MSICQRWLHLPGPPAKGQKIITNVNKHYPTSKYLKHCCQPTNLCLVVTISSLGLSWMLCSSLIRSSAVLSTPSCLALTSSSCCTRASHNIVMRSSVTSCDNVTDHENSWDQFCSFLLINRGDRIRRPITCVDLVQVRLDSGSNILLLMFISLGQLSTQTYFGPRPDPTLALLWSSSPSHFSHFFALHFSSQVYLKYHQLWIQCENISVWWVTKY